MTKMKKTLKIALIGLTLLAAGCMNCYVRCPFTKPEITDTYQCTQDSFVYSYVIMFPQVMAPGPRDKFYPENIITVPIGCLCFVDVACEAVIDTALWPVDKLISNSRKEKIVFLVHIKSNRDYGF